MVTRKMNRILLYAMLTAAAIVSLSGGTGFAKGEDSDFLRRITNALPPGWSVDISSCRGKCFVNITTVPMDTQASRYGNSFPGERRMRLGISLAILPRYTTEMLDRIRTHNKPVRKQLDTMDYYSDEYREVESKLIDEPMFYDGSYGFSIRYPSRAPSKADDSRKLLEVFAAISSDWKSYDASKPDVAAELRRILTR